MQAAQPQPEPTSKGDDVAYRYACTLAQAIFDSEYASDPDYASGRVKWGLCDSTAGVLTQIDNMVSGMTRNPSSQQREPQEAAEHGYDVDPKETVGDLAQRVGAWETADGYVSFGSWQAVAAFRHHILAGAAKQWQQMQPVAEALSAPQEAGKPDAQEADDLAELEDLHRFLLREQALARDHQSAECCRKWAAVVQKDIEATRAASKEAGKVEAVAVVGDAELNRLMFEHMEIDHRTRAAQRARLFARAVEAAVCAPLVAELERLNRGCKVEAVADEPFAYYVYIPAEQRGELVHDLDEATDDLTNCECEVSKLYLRPSQQALSDVPALVNKIKRTALDTPIEEVAPGLRSIVGDCIRIEAILAAAGGSQ